MRKTDIINFSLSTDLIENKECGEIPDYNQFVKPFQLRGKQYEGEQSMVDQHIFLMNMAYSVFGSAMKPERQKINNKDYRYKRFISDKFFDEILEQSLEARKQGCDNYMFDD